ncbi:uncharacterized protein C05D11.1-like [Orussus abietinus]|uniref:uncharacterized protein C05D11.1-like n=1 Tax=Orussus abietinus TaxID=222816 RepID=UPI000626022C|nr:uncharacterized protein C05D11.1-like [Orussus abietinus]
MNNYRRVIRILLEHLRVTCASDLRTWQYSKMAPVDNSPASNMGGFELVCSLKSNDTIPVHKYKSTNTGLTVVIAEVGGPVVCGYFCLATEAFDDDGLPHTLEHLIFLGSEKYPYKGILDLLANRCLASGTNAWTDTDNTVYTMTTAGSEGFLSLMPIYLEHILYPVLQDSAFLTEVHHITGEGEDAGVIYCEMQGKENTAECLIHVEMLRALYPGHCGYKSATGGLLKNLRESTTNEKVKQFHKEFYRPENLTIVIVGQVKHTDVFKALHPLEEKILSKGPRGPFKKPWQSPVPPFTESVDLVVPYPCDDEDNGFVNVGWRGPSAVTEVYDLIGCSILLKYLTDTSVSPLEKEFVEISDPFATNVTFSLVENSVSIIYLMFESVPKDKIPLVKDRLMKVLKAIGEGETMLDMKRLDTVIHRHILETLSNLENDPHNAVAFMLIGDVLYGNSEQDLSQRLNQIEDLEKLSKEPMSYWINLLKKYMLDAPITVIKGVPSVEKHKELTEKEKDRVAKQIKLLGVDGLHKKDAEFRKAVEQNETPIPDGVLTSVPIPNTDSINFHQIKSYSTDLPEQHPRFDVSNLPFYTYLDHVNTNFVYMFIIMDTSSIPREYRAYIPLLLEAIMECPVKRDGKLIPYESVVSELEADTVATSTRKGFENTSRFSCGAYSHTANFMLQLEPAKYNKGIQWVKELLYETELTVERLKIIAAKIANEVPQVKRRGSKIVVDLMKGLLYNKDSNHYATNLLHQQKFLNKVMERLGNESTQKEVIAEIETVRKILTTPKNMVLYLAMNVDKQAMQVPDLNLQWNTLFSNFKNVEKGKLNTTPDWKLMNTPEEVPAKSCVTGLGCVDSAFFCQCTEGIKDFESPDLAPLLVGLQYLTQLESAMWRQIRGKGLVYSYDVFTRPNEGLSYLSFYRATNVVGAYKEAKSIIESHISKNKWERLLFESAKSSLIFEIIYREKTIGDLVTQSLLSYFKNVPHDYNRQLVQRISGVTIDDIARVTKKYLQDLLDPKLCKTTIVCHPSKAPEVAKGFKDLNHDLTVYHNLEESFLNES